MSDLGLTTFEKLWFLFLVFEREIWTALGICLLLIGVGVATWSWIKRTEEQ